MVVWRLDRLSRSLRDVLMIMERIKEAKAGFKSLREAIHTTTVSGTMMLQMVGAFAEFERAILRDRTKADWMLPGNGAASEGVVQSSGRINRMKSLRWFQRAPKLPLMPRASSTSIRLRCREYWPGLAPGRSGQWYKELPSASAPVGSRRSQHLQTKTEWHRTRVPRLLFRIRILAK